LAGILRAALVKDPRQRRITMAAIAAMLEPKPGQWDPAHLASESGHL
jgi:hypothetical protein